MAITKNKILKNFEFDAETLSISIAYDIVLTDSVEGELARKRYRRAFAQGEIQGVKDWTGISSNQHPLIIFLNSVWA